MRTFIITMFWIYSIGTLIRLVLISVSEYPRLDKRSIGYDLATVVEYLVFVAWTAVLLWVL